MSDSSRPHRLPPTRLLHPWDFPGKGTGVGCHCLLWVGLDFSIKCIVKRNKSWKMWGPRDSHALDQNVQSTTYCWPWWNTSALNTESGNKVAVTLPSSLDSWPILPGSSLQLRSRDDERWTEDLKNWVLALTWSLMSFVILFKFLTLIASVSPFHKSRMWVGGLVGLMIPQL